MKKEIKEKLAEEVLAVFTLLKTLQSKESNARIIIVSLKSKYYQMNFRSFLLSILIKTIPHNINTIPNWLKFFQLKTIKIQEKIKNY